MLLTFQAIAAPTTRDQRICRHGFANRKLRKIRRDLLTDGLNRAAEFVAHDQRRFAEFVFTLETAEFRAADAGIHHLDQYFIRLRSWYRHIAHRHLPGTFVDKRSHLFVSHPVSPPKYYSSARSTR